MSQSQRSSTLAVASIAIPVPMVLIGLLMVFTAPLSQGDWLGMGRIVPALIAFFGASIFGVLLSVSSFLRREPKAGASLIGGIPSFFFLAWVGFTLGPAYRENRILEERAEIRRQIIGDSAFRASFVSSDKLTIKDADIFIDREVANALSAEEVRYLWTKWKSVRTGWNFDALTLSKNTPPDVLEEYYSIIRKPAIGSDGKISPHFLYSREQLLLNPNLPPSILREIESLNDPVVTKVLKERK